MFAIRVLFGCIGAVLLATSGGASAQSHIVIVNGRLLSDAEVSYLARMACADIPDGNSWLNMNTGVWGYTGDPTVRGTLGDACRGASPDYGVNQDGTIGPFATLRRAEEVANEYRAQGRRAVAFHNGNGYYVRVSR